MFKSLLVLALVGVLNGVPARADQLDPARAVALFENSADVQAAIQSLEGAGFKKARAPQAALIHAAFGDEGFNGTYLISEQMNRGKAPMSLQTTLVTAIVTLDSMATAPSTPGGGGVRIVDSNKVLNALKSL